LRLVAVFAVSLPLLAAGQVRAQEKERAYLIETAKGLPTAKELSAKSEDGWVISGVVRVGDGEDSLWYFTRNPLGKQKIEYEVVAEQTDYKDAGPLNKDRGNKGWQLVAVIDLHQEGKPGPYRYVYAKLGDTHAHGILTVKAAGAKELVGPEKLDEQWGKMGFRLVSVVPSAAEPGAYKYYIVLPAGKQTAREHKALSAGMPLVKLPALEELGKDGWRLVHILPTDDADQPYIFWFTRKKP
jgi:hypothetical protein